MAPCYSQFFCILTLSLSFHFYGISAVQTYTVSNEAPQTKGCIRWEKEVGVEASKAILSQANEFIWFNVFQQKDPADQKCVNEVDLYIGGACEHGDGVSWGNNKINISHIFLEKYVGDLKWGLESLIYHELTHVFQWNGEGTTPSWLLDGIADYTFLKANKTGLGVWDLGEGDKWDEGYQVTARFLEYCDGITPGFVAKLNKMMRFKYNVSYFAELTGKPVEQLWNDYKAKYPQPPK